MMSHENYCYWRGALDLAGRKFIAALCIFVSLFFLTMPAEAVLARISDKASSETLASPYFVVDSGQTNVRFPLKDTKVEARISGLIADVVVRQHYRNEGALPIEARYVFPGSTRAAIYAMKVSLGDRELIAEIQEKEKAKNEYETAKREGKTTALLEQHRANVFQMNVANIMPGDDVEVELRYTELIVASEGEYQFVYPTVVGPRYNGAPGEGSGTNEKWLATPHLPEGIASESGFELDIELISPVDIQEAYSPSHGIEERVVSGRERHIKPASADVANDRDFILNYRLGGDAMQSGILMSKNDGGENFFIALLQPPRRIDRAAIVPRDYIFVVDVSGSMHGFPLDTAKTLLQDLIANLRPTDTFNVMLFSGGNRMLSPRSVPATQKNIDKAINIIDRQSGGGGTELIPALKRALAQPVDEYRSRTFIVITDGYVSVENDAYKLVRENLNQANLFAFGIGSSVNRELIEGLARAGSGEPFVVIDGNSAKKEAKRLRKMIEAPLLTHLSASFTGLDVYDVEPQALPDVFADRPVVLFGKWRGPARGSLVLQGQGADGPYRTELMITQDLPRTGNSALRYLWARHRIASLSDQEKLAGSDRYAKEITRLGLAYSLLTQYTSFVAVDHRVRNPAGNSETVDQPLPLPQGVSNFALSGSAISSTPEPGFWAMLLVALLVSAIALRRRYG